MILITAIDMTRKYQNYFFRVVLTHICRQHLIYLLMAKKKKLHANINRHERGVAGIL
jgi:hypothetical protein